MSEFDWYVFFFGAAIGGLIAAVGMYAVACLVERKRATYHGVEVDAPSELRDLQAQALMWRELKEVLQEQDSRGEGASPVCIGWYQGRQVLVFMGDRADLKAQYQDVFMSQSRTIYRPLKPRIDP
jgi:hypothetical protein